jgi:hypothetical protein
MKKAVFVLMSISILCVAQINAQGFLKKVTKSMTDELLGKPQVGTNVSNKNADQPEPACACDKAELVMDMGGKLQLDYSELDISLKDDGRILAKHRWMDEYYIVQNGVTTGPLKPGDQRLTGFNKIEPEDAEKEKNPWANNEYITKSGEKYLITFGGKNYGPYDMISNFKVTRSKDKFAAAVTENMVINADEGKKMDEAIKNAKTDQEKMDLAMKYSQQLQQKMMQGGGPGKMTPKIVTNVPGATIDPMIQAVGLNNNIKYDEILVASWDKITDLQGKTIVTLKQDFINAEQIFLNSDNSKYAMYRSGVLTFSDNTSLPELFNPYLVKVNGQVYIAYMYYSPKKNAIMQCKIPF